MANVSDIPRRDLEDWYDAHKFSKTILKWSLILITFLVMLIWCWKLVSPRYTLYQANIERQVQVADARAKAEAATLLADAEVERSKGVAEANAIIADSLTPEYITWLYVDQLDRTDNQIIYIPTEGGLPILEAGQRP